MIVKNSENQSLTVKGKTLCGVTFKGILEHGTDNTAIAQSDIDYSKIFVKCTLRRLGRDMVVFQDNLKVLLFESAFFNALFEQIAPGNTAATGLVLVAPAALTKSIALNPGAVNFGGNLNLRGSDELTIEVQMNQPFSANLNTSNSFLEFDVIESVGYETFTPRIETKAIKGGESRIQESLGDNVMSVAFINFDKTAITTAAQVINSVSLSSDRVSITDNYNELLSKRARQFELQADAALRAQSFMLVQAEQMDRVSLDMTLTAANVNTAKCYIVTRTFYTDGRTMKLAELAREKHAIEAAGKFGYGNGRELAERHAAITVQKTNVERA